MPGCDPGAGYAYCDPDFPTDKTVTVYRTDQRLFDAGTCIDGETQGDLVVWVAQHWPYCPGTCASLGFTKRLKDVTMEFGDMGEWAGTQWLKPDATDILNLFMQ